MLRTKLKIITSIVLVNSYLSNIVFASVLPVNDSISSHLSDANDLHLDLNMSTDKDLDEIEQSSNDDTSVTETNEEIKTNEESELNEETEVNENIGNDTKDEDLIDNSNQDVCLPNNSHNIEVSSDEANDNKSLSETNSINSIVEDNWLNREVARQLNKDYTELTDEDYLLIKELNMVNSNVTGTIPKEVGKLLNLTRFDLYNNNLTGEIPLEFFNLTKLTHISIARNNLTGSIPKEIGNLKELRVIGLRSNNLTGSIPKEIGNLKHLTEFWVFDNNLTGEIPEEFSNLINLTQLHLYDNQFISVGDNFPEKFKTEAILKGNFIEGIPNQKQIKLLNEHEINLEVGDVLDISSIKPSVVVDWNGSEETLSSSYTVVPVIENNDFFDSNLNAIKVGSTNLKIRLLEGNLSNSAILSDSEFKVTISKKYVPLSLTYTVDKKDWTNENVSIQIIASGSENISYIILPNGEKVHRNTVNYIVSENGDYIFKAVNVAGEEKEITVNINNIDNTPPTINQSETILVSGNSLRIDLSKIQTLSGIFRIILPDGRIIENPSENYIDYTTNQYGLLEFKIIDKAGNISIINYEVKNNVDSSQNNNEITLPNTSGLRFISIFLGLALMLAGLVVLFGKRD